MARTTMNSKESPEYQNKFVTEVYEHKWTLPKWFLPNSVNNSERDDLTYEIYTGKPNRLQTRWIFWIKSKGITFRTGGPVFYETHWKMVEMKNFKGEIEAKATMSTCDTGSTSKWIKDKVQFNKVKLNELFNKCFYEIQHEDTSENEVTLNLKLILKIPTIDWMTHLHKMCLKKADTDFLEILNDEKTADLKIITSDEKELFAHKCILKARCPVFELMFHSNYIENNTGIVNVEDISGKTMRILLHFFYSGQLLPSWRDQDTIVEFVYAAGKYQITEVLEILDLNVGIHEDNSSELDEQLMDITSKLGLSNAEARLMRHIKKRKRKIEIEQEVELIELEK